MKLVSESYLQFINEFGPLKGSGNRNYKSNELVDRIGELDDILMNNRRAEREWERLSQKYLDGEEGSTYWSDLSDRDLESAIDDAGHLMKKYNINISENLNEKNADDIEKIHFETDPRKQEKLKLVYGESLGGITQREKIENADYVLKRFRKKIKYGNGKDTGPFKPGSSSSLKSKLGDGPHDKKIKRKSWNRRSYDKWIRAVASEGGAENAFDMAQNAKFEPGLIEWVRKNNPGEDPLNIIQWDIESYA